MQLLDFSKFQQRAILPKCLRLAVNVDHSTGKQATIRQSPARVNKMNKEKLRIG